MLFSVVSILSAAAVVGAQSSTTPAPQVTGNPAGATYSGSIIAKPGSSLSGSIVGTTAPGGTGVKFTVSFAGLPSTGGPFMYHIHQYPVPANGNCTGTGAHLDPYMRGEVPVCDASMPQTCQVGDLSGKHGNITSTSFSAEYVDAYLSTNPASNAFFGNLAFVVHLANKTRIGCGNFSMVGGSYSTGVPVPMPTGNATKAPTYSVPAPTPITTGPPQITGAASALVGGTGAVLGFLAVLLL